MVGSRGQGVRGYKEGGSRPRLPLLRQARPRGGAALSGLCPSLWPKSLFQLPGLHQGIVPQGGPLHKSELLSRSASVLLCHQEKITAPL